MLAFDDAALAHLMIAASRVSPRKRSRWLKEIAARLDPPDLEATSKSPRSAIAERQARSRARRKNGVTKFRPRSEPAREAALAGFAKASRRG